ncbi:hypothetical protein UFOVP836_50 [uncultured Caudovirales phage]|uniref:Uncharacterized protein n=1 Tax=uncultured Caudovirales phage TaxID=2100421 RepID=A0A6J5PB84_9CAUD|nr:hypothetical protein UFOVP836_50 [uncultured Caudovirales phage]
MGISVLIQSTLRNNLTGRDGVSITKALRAIPTASIRTVDKTGAFLPAVGNLIEVQDDLGGPTVTLFGGSINEVERIRRRTSIATLETNCSCVGKADRLERRLAGYYEYTGKTGGYILGQMVANSLSGDIDIASPSGIAAGPVIDSLVWDYPTCKDAADSVCNLTGYEYYVKPDGTFSYFQTSSNACPVSITTGANVNKITTRETREDFCNRVTIKVANALRDPETENFTGDGVATSFNVTNPIAQAPDIFIGSPAVAQTVGIIDVDTGKDWYWQEGSTEIRQDSGATVISSGVSIMVTYVGTESILVSAANTTSISDRATAESNSGIYHKLLTLDTKLTRANAQAVADAYVDRYSELSVVMVFETDTLLEPDCINIEPGQTLTVSLTGYQCAGTYLVRSVTLQSRLNDQHEARWAVRVEAVSGPVLRNYVDVFRDLSGGGGSVSGSSSIASAGSGAGVYVYEPAKLTANTTITAPVPATKGATMVVFIKQGAGPYSISFDPDQFAQIVNTSIPAVEDMEIAFPFVGRADGLWWPMSFAREMS